VVVPEILATNRTTQTGWLRAFGLIVLGLAFGTT
jgi:hypothetical protein